MGLVPLKSTTTGVDIFEAVKSSLEKFKLDPLKLVSVTPDEAPAMFGKNKGFVTLLEKHLIELGNQNNLIKRHCIIHQEALCAKNADVSDVMSVVKVVNLILSNGLKHRQFQQLISEANEHYADLLYFCDVCWLSRGRS